MTKASRIITALLMTMSLSACSAGYTSYQKPPATAGSAINIATTSAASSLDFTNTSGAAIPQALMANVYEGLVRLNSQGTLEPLLATSWDISPDRREYVFHLREDVRFSDGAVFNAHSAKFSIDRVKTSWTNGIKSAMDVVNSTEVLDDYTLKVTLSKPSNQWLWSMATTVGAMMSETGVDKLASDPIGTGPYKVTHWSAGHSVGFTAREDYWGPAPKNSAATIRYFSDATAATNALKSHDVDLVWSMQAPELLSTLSDFTIDVGSTQGEMVLSMNNQRAPFDDVRVRQAVMYGINRQAIIDTAMEGYGTDTGGVPVPPTDPWYEKSERYPFDPARARELLKEAGAVGTPITLSMPSLPYTQVVSEILYSELRDIGFNPTIKSTEFPAVWVSEVLKNHDYDMSLINHVEPRDIPVLFNPKYYLGFNDERTTSLIGQADSDTDQTGYMKQAVTRIMELAGADTLMNVPNIVVMKPDIEGVDPDIVSGALELSPISRRNG